MNVEHSFFLNDCIPSTVDKHIFIEKLSATIIEFNKLLEKDIKVARGIVTHKQPSLCEYNGGYNLHDAIDSIEDRSTKNLAYSLFLRFPIGRPHFDDDFEELMTSSFGYTIKGERFDALNLAIVWKNGGFIMSPAISEQLATDIIEISVNATNDSLKVPNLYGSEINTTAIVEVITKRNQVNLNIFELFLSLFEQPKYTNQFHKDFNNLSQNSKEMIISHFEEAKLRKLPTHFSSDGDLIKDVSPDKKKCNVFELRVRKDKELRVYFNESGNNMYFASIGFKNNNQQDQDIKYAHIALYKLILTN
ncbi:hypothetical protein ACUN24_21905 [Pedobacter sp. WC2501]|uniref:hypothetical protein n=1 Tax=Pedobacter sp. WC2501 TaxID=3461400 RepID=UPI0040460298